MKPEFGHEELKRLLRRMDEIDEPSLPPARDRERFEASVRAPLSKLDGEPKTLVADPAVALPPPGKRAEVSSKSRKFPTRRIAVIVAVGGVVGAVLMLRLPALSIVAMRDGVSHLKSQMLLPAMPNPRNTDLDLQSLRSVTPGQLARPLLAMTLQKISLQRGQVWPLGVRTTAQGDGITLVVKGLAAGTKLSAGQLLETNNWGLDANDLNDVVLSPPDGFVGTMDLTIELLQNGATADRLSVQVEWLGQKAAPTPQVANASPIPGNATRLLERGEEFLARGEIVAARLVFKRLADSGEARAALALAETYEQSTLERLGARGLAPDMATARSWYEKAKELGSPEAQSRLDALVTPNN